MRPPATLWLDACHAETSYPVQLPLQHAATNCLITRWTCCAQPTWACMPPVPPLPTTCPSRPRSVCPAAHSATSVRPLCCFMHWQSVRQAHTRSGALHALACEAQLVIPNPWRLCHVCVIGSLPTDRRHMHNGCCHMRSHCHTILQPPACHSNVCIIPTCRRKPHTSN